MFAPDSTNPDTKSGGGFNMASPAGALISAGASIFNQYAQNKANKRMAEYSYSKDLEQWHRQNQYNDPSAQMQRLKNAGINPHTIGGNSSASGNATQLPKYNSPQLQFNAIPQMIGQLSQFQELKRTQAMTDNIRAMTELTGQKAASEFFNRALTRQALKKAKIDLDTYPERNIYSLEKLKWDAGMSQRLFETQNYKKKTEKYRSQWAESGDTLGGNKAIDKIQNELLQSLWTTGKKKFNQYFK